MALPTGKIISEAALVSAQEAYKQLHGKYQNLKLGVYAPNIEIDEYVGPLGVGFILYEYASDVGLDYCRKTNYGPEDRFSSGWILLN
jgi:hypothetical protein